MGVTILARHIAHGSGKAALGRLTLARVLSVAALVCCIAGCHRVPPLDTKPLDTAGMSYDTIQELKALQITAPEVTELAAARQGGLSDSGCVQIVKTYRSRNQAFDAGDAVAGLIRAQVRAATVLELAQLNQLGLNAGELQAMRLAGLSDDILLEVARHHAAGTPVLAGVSLANLKNVGVREGTLLELVRRGVPDSQAAAIIAVRRRGASDTEILRRFSGS
jgi:hypothetical protein